jgi:hypothetical protein
MYDALTSIQGNVHHPTSLSSVDPALAQQGTTPVSS